MQLSQTQIIQSLSEALAWFEKEIGWGVPPAELNHLTGRIGELYAAMITRGQMALDVNQRGYDVINSDNERISVKTVTSSVHVSFNSSTFDLVDRVMVLRINVDDDDGISVETLLDSSATDFLKEHATDSERIVFRTVGGSRPKVPLELLAIVQEGSHGRYRIQQYENATIRVLFDGEPQAVAKPVLRNIAAQIGVDLLNSNGNPKNTRSLGADIISVLKAQTGG